MEVAFTASKVFLYPCPFGLLLHTNFWLMHSKLWIFSLFQSFNYLWDPKKMGQQQQQQQQQQQLGQRKRKLPWQSSCVKFP